MLSVGTTFLPLGRLIFLSRAFLWGGGKRNPLHLVYSPRQSHDPEWSHIPHKYAYSDSLYTLQFYFLNLGTTGIVTFFFFLIIFFHFFILIILLLSVHFL